MGDFGPQGAYVQRAYVWRLTSGGRAYVWGGLMSWTLSLGLRSVGLCQGAYIGVDYVRGASGQGVWIRVAHVTALLRGLLRKEPSVCGLIMPMGF